MIWKKLMSLEISNKEQLQTFQGNNCFISNLVSVSNYYLGEKQSEKIFYANNGHRYHFGNWVSSDGLRSYPTLICFDADVDKQEIMEEFDEMGLALRQVVLQNTDEVVAFVKEMVSQDTPVIVNVNSNYMDHWPIPIRGNYAHYIILYGINEEEQSFSIVDNYIPDTPVKCYKGTLQFDSFLKSLDFSDVRINHGRNIVWVLEKKKDVENPSILEPKQIQMNMLKRTCRNMLTYQEERQVCIKDFTYQYHSGIAGLISFKQYLVSFLEKEEVTDFDKEIFVELYKNITSFGGPINTLTMLKEYLEEMETNKKFSIIAENINKITDLWNKLGISIFRYTIMESSKLIQRAQMQLEEIIALEKENIILMQECTEMFIENQKENVKGQVMEPLNKKNSFPKTAYLFPSMLCNLHCKMCYSGAHQNADLLQDEMSFETYKELIAQLYQRGVRKFDISGGEPLLSEKFYQIVKEIKAYEDTVVYVVSNGTLIKKYREKLVSVLPYIDRLHISIDSVKEEIHNQIRGSKNAFAESVEGLSILQEMGVKNIGINFLIMSDNQEQIQDILHFARSHGYRYVNLLRLLDVPEQKELYEQNLNMDTFVQTYLKVQDWVKEETSKGVGTPLDITLVLPGYCVKEILPYRNNHYVGASIKLSVEYDPFRGCTAFHNAIVISAKGDFTGCTAMFTLKEFTEGSLKEQSISSILDNWSENEKRIKERELYLKDREPCKDCPYWRHCKGGCPAVTYKYYHTIMKNDPTCIRMQQTQGGK